METHKRPADLISEERQRQINSEGWTPAHDDQHYDAELYWAALSYLNNNGSPVKPPTWPWEDSWWKPTYHLGGNGHIKQVVKAGALFLAEKQRVIRSDMPMVYQELITKHLQAFIGLCEEQIKMLQKPLIP